MIAFTRNQHGDSGLGSLQKVDVAPLEGFTVVGLQVTEQQKLINRRLSDRYSFTHLLSE